MKTSDAPPTDFTRRLVSDAPDSGHRAPCRLAVIGCGMRLGSYLRELPLDRDGGMRVVAMADPDPDAIERYRGQFGLQRARAFDSALTLFAAMGDEVDAVIIASSNTSHREAMEPAVARRLPILLEKPVATTLEDCVAMWRSYVNAGRPPLSMGFVLRYAPFYREVKQLIDNGVLGRILTVQATEELDPSLTSHFMRQWRRFSSLAGPFILEKCSHDLDILTWLIGGKPETVSSFAARTRFVPDPQAAERCRDCAKASTCRYSVNLLPSYVIDPRSNAKVQPIHRDDDLCVFNSEKDIPDHQVVNLRFDSGVLASFAATMDQPITTRTLKVQGTRGQLIGDIRRNEMKLIEHPGCGGRGAAVTDIQIVHDGSGHDGADSGISREFADRLAGRDVAGAPGLREGIEACVLAFAADASSRTGRVVDAGQLRKQVFG